MSTTPRDERVARAALSAVVEPGAVRVARHVAQHGAVATWRAVVAGGQPFDRDGALARRAAGIDGAAVLTRAADLDIRFVCPEDPAWPAELATMDATLVAGADAVPPPFGLWVRGDGAIDPPGPRAVAVVGARAASPYGIRVATDLGADLTMLGWSVVSGAAHGIDAAAHRGALAMAGGTFAVLACGLDIAYPRSHRELLERIAGTGLVFSELPPGATPMRSRFIARNRIIAALTAGTVVVEAALRSGALNTAHWAAKLGRTVMMLPGPVTSQLSAGCHEWIRNKGATLVSDAAEVVDAAGRLGVDAVAAPVGEDRVLDRYPPRVRDVYERMPTRAPVTGAALAAGSGYPASSVASALRTLERDGLVAERNDGWVRVRGAT
ncbi:DNA-processing protein DprA [Phytoactinopolyspora limicola]|uniref:DNA-processing protein DprA n=1 Tax=Phytoactinopolyspora limicola TaxID=2715536 RepID=UPI00140769DD|nr:DNA-processing protein DprA [Phytoactinopolyspora limicola]